MDLKRRILNELERLFQEESYEQLLYKENVVGLLFKRVNGNADIGGDEFVMFKDFFYALTELFSEVEKTSPIFYLLAIVVKSADYRDFLSYRKKDVDYGALGKSALN